MIGDTVHNLRSALDHLAWQLVEANGGAPTDKTAFPMSNSADAFESARGRQMKGIASDAQELIRSVQAYHSYHNRHLAALAALDNVDKHRLLIVAVCRLDGVGYGI